MAFSRILALLPLLISATGLVPSVHAGSVANDAYRFSRGGGDYPIPKNYTVPLAPPAAAGAASGFAAPPPGVIFDTALPPPPSNVTLAYIVLVRGVWNYTCENSSDAAQPVSIGGLATLYDLAPVIPYLASENDLHRFPPLAVNVTKNHIQQVFDLKPIGQFYHSSPHTAIIDMGKKGLLVGATAGHLVRAGAGAPQGPDGSGALGWLIGFAQPGSVGLEMFYRVEVAGGVEPTNCEGRPFMNAREFACEYWIYK